MSINNEDIQCKVCSQTTLPQKYSCTNNQLCPEKGKKYSCSDCFYKYHKNCPITINIHADILTLLKDQHLQAETSITESMNYPKYLNMKRIILESLNRIDQGYLQIQATKPLLDRFKQFQNQSSMNDEQIRQAKSFYYNNKINFTIQDNYQSIDGNLKVIKHCLDNLFEKQEHQVVIKPVRNRIPNTLFKSNWDNTILSQVIEIRQEWHCYSISMEKQQITIVLKQCIEVWDFIKGTLIIRFPQLDFLTKGITYTSDHRFAFLRSHNQIRIFDTQTYKLIGQPIDTSSKVTKFGQYDIHCSPNSKYLMIISSEGRIQIWNIQSIEFPLQIQFQTTQLSNIIGFSPDSKLLVNYAFGRCHLFDTRTLTRINMFQSNLTSIIFSSKNKCMFVDDGDRIYMWSLRPLKRINKIQMPNDIFTFCVSPNQKYLATNESIWNYNTRKYTSLHFQNQTKPLGFTPDERFLVLENSSFIQVFDLSHSIYRLR